MESRKKNKSQSFFVNDMIDYFLQTVQYGDLILTVQDGVVVGIEKKEKFKITAKDRNTKYVVTHNSIQNHPSKDEILTELCRINYGQLIIQLEKGQVGKIEKTEKWRTDELRGMYGDGI